MIPLQLLLNIRDDRLNWKEQIRCRRSSLISDLKLQIQVEYSLRVHQIEFGDQQLQDDQSLMHYGVQNESILFLRLGSLELLDVSASRIQIFIEDMIRGQYTVDCCLTDTVLSLKYRLYDKSSIPPDHQRLLINGDLIEDSQLLRDCGIEADSTVCMMLRLSGMISSFTTTVAKNEFDGFLLGTNTAPSIESFLIRWPESRYGCYAFSKDPRNILSPLQRMTCKRFMDLLWEEMSSPSNEYCDLKVKFANEQAAAMLLSFRLTVYDNEFNPEAMRDIKALHPERSNIALRCTRGPTNGAIGWHFDGFYANKTVQMALNDDSEYEGGRLCFFTPEYGVRVLERQAGDISIHGRDVLHAVTQLTSGTRYGLFVVDVSNGLGDQLVVEPTVEQTSRILSRLQQEHLNEIRIINQGKIPSADLVVSNLIGTGTFKKM